MPLKEIFRTHFDRLLNETSMAWRILQRNIPQLNEVIELVGYEEPEILKEIKARVEFPQEIL